MAKTTKKPSKPAAKPVQKPSPVPAYQPKGGGAKGQPQTKDAAAMRFQRDDVATPQPASGIPGYTPGYTNGYVAPGVNNTTLAQVRPDPSQYYTVGVNPVTLGRMMPRTDPNQRGDSFSDRFVQPRGRRDMNPEPTARPYIRPPLGGAYFDTATQLVRGNYNGQPGVIRPPVGGVYATEQAFLPAYESGGYSSGGNSGDYGEDDGFPRYRGGGGGGGYSPREYEDPAWLAGLMNWRF